MVSNMKLKDITKKLVKNNFKEYALLIFSVAFAVCMTTTMAMIQFSPSVLNVLVPGGSSQMTALALYVIMMIGCITFIIFAQGLFMRYKSKEIGIFMSLGIKKDQVKKIVKKEMAYIIPLAAIIGIILAIPVSFICWNSIGVFFSNTESKFRIGWVGVIIGIIFTIVAKIIIDVITAKYISKVDILKILKTSSEVEEVKGGKPSLGIMGMLFIILGPVFINVSLHTSHPIWGKAGDIGMVLCILGVYFFAAQVSTIGSIVKNISSKAYYKNLVFFNFMKLKGKQYTLSLFVGTLLTGVGLFSLLFNIGPLIEGNAKIQSSSSDFEFTSISHAAEIKKEEINKLANEYELNVTKFKEIDGILLTSYNHLSDFGDEWWWGEDEIFVSESNFNKFFRENVDVNRGKYVVAVDYKVKGDHWNELVRPRYVKKFYDASSKKEIAVEPEETIEIKDKMSSSFFYGYIRILDDADYISISNEIPNEFKFTHKAFDVDNLNKSMKFTNKFYDSYLEKLNYEYDDDIRYRGKYIIEGNKQHTKTKIKELTPDMKRWWWLMPFSKIDALLNNTNIWVVYLVVFFVISITCLVAGSLVVGVKIINGMWHDKIIFKNITFIGAKKRNIKSVINKQIALIYLVPNMLAILMVAQIYSAIIKNGCVYFNEIMQNVYMISGGFIAIQFIIFKVISKKVFKQCTNFENL